MPQWTSLCNKEVYQVNLLCTLNSRDVMLCQWHLNKVENKGWCNENEIASRKFDVKYLTSYTWRTNDSHVGVCSQICLSIHLFLYMKSRNVWKWQSSYKNSSLGNTYSLGLVPQEKIFREQNKFRKDSCPPLYLYIFNILVSFNSSELYTVLTWNCYFLK